MSADGRRNVRASSGDHPICCKDASMQPFCQGRVFNDGGVDCFAPFPSGVPPLRDMVAALVNVTEYIETFRLFLDARRLTTIH